MKSHRGMKITRAVLLASALIAAACGKDDSVASKSAAAYREAQAKRIPVADGHEHGGHSATETGAEATDHSAHTGETGVDHAAMGHTSSDAGGHAGHDASTEAVDHSAMGHATSGASGHSQHIAGTSMTDSHAGHARQSAGAAHDTHAGMQHNMPSSGANAHAGHATQTTTAPMDHSQHTATPTTAARASAATTAHAHHGSASTPAAAGVTTTTSTVDVRKIQPAATLRSDEFDAPAPISVSEAAKASQAGSHAGHVSGASPAGAETAGTIYTCPMHPEVTSDKPGTCPKCGMTLVKKEK